MTEKEIEFLQAIVTGDELARFVYADWLSDNGREEEAFRQRQLAGLVKKTYLEAGPLTVGVKLRMVLCGPRGAVQFLLQTHWINQERARGRIETGRQIGTTEMLEALLQPIPMDLGFHSLVIEGDG